MHLLNAIRAVWEPILRDVLPGDTSPDDFLAMVRPAQNADVADYQANFAMPLGKRLGKKPTELAQELVAQVSHPLIARASVAGPGFINIKLADAALTSALESTASDDRLGVSTVSPQTFVIDYSGPNVAKPLHVGHLRSTIIGDSLARLLRFLGHTVIGDNHLGDWGTQFGMLLYGYKHLLDREAFARNPVQELARLYKEVRKLAAADDEDAAKNEVADAYRLETVKLHAGDPENVALWQHFMPACMVEVNAAYRRLDVKFDHMHGESFYNGMLPAVVSELLAKNIAEPSEGAIIVRGDKESVSLIRKRDGAFTYTTTDLATIRYRVETWKPSAMLYVVDSRQAEHFRNLFSTAKKWGYDSADLVHVSFGSVLGKDGKPLKTRDGTPVTLESLLDESVEMGASQYRKTRQERIERGEEVPPLTDEEIAHIAEVVGIGAVKYADLCQNRTTDYTYSPEKMLATDGNTATYMQYAYARCRNVLRKAEVDVERLRSHPPTLMLVEPEERALALALLRVEESLYAAASEYLPHYLTGYLWDLAKAMSSFYASKRCAVLKAESDDLRQSRLALCDRTARTIQLVLGLLGIHTLEQM